MWTKKVIREQTDNIKIQTHSLILRRRILDEISYALGATKNGFVRNLLPLIINHPATKMAQIIANFYYHVVNDGISPGAKITLPCFNVTVTSRGDTQIPKTGPLLLVSNHPGGLDSLGIISIIPRNDFKVLVSDVNFLRDLDRENLFFIYVDFKSQGGMLALREAIDHLHKGGVVLLFAHGEVEPDPECIPGALESINDWSSSIEIMLRKVPNTVLQILSVSGAILPKFFNNPIARIRKSVETRQKLAEFMQTINSVIKPRPTKVNIHISVSKPDTFGKFAKGNLMPEVVSRAQLAMNNHLDWVKTLVKPN
jgi:hypothetical protein